jgi:hypothetical protein
MSLSEGDQNLRLEHYLCSKKLLSVIYIIWKLCVLQTLCETVQSSRYFLGVAGKLFQSLNIMQIQLSFSLLQKDFIKRLTGLQSTKLQISL